MQTYVYVAPNRVEGVRGGVYYFHPLECALVPVTLDATIPAEVHVTWNREIFACSAFSIFLIADMRAIEPIYQHMARDYAMLEAGYMGQLLMSRGPDHGVGLCPIGGLDFPPIARHFALDASHVPLHVLVGGAIDATQASFDGLRSELQASAPTFASPSDPLSRVRKHAEETLPRALVPTRWISLSALPLGSTGKVDRGALARLVAEHAQAKARRAPENDIERRLCAIVGSVLRVSDVSVDESVFSLGANSLSLMQIHREIIKAFQREVRVVDMFQAPTIEDFARLLEEPDNLATTSASVSRAADRGRTRAERARSAKDRRST